jgi:hypothetical protein
VKTSSSQNSGLASRPAHAVSPASAAGRAGRAADDRAVEPRVDGRFLRPPRVRVDRLGLHARQRGQRGQRADVLEHRVVQGIAGRITGLHHLLAGRREHEVDEFLRLGPLGGGRLGVDADRARQQRHRVEVLDGQLLVAEHRADARRALHERQLDLAAGQRLQRGPVGRVDDQPVGLQLGEVALARAHTAEVVHHPGDERVGRAGLRRVVHPDLALPLRSEQLLPGRGRVGHLGPVVDERGHQGDAGRGVALVGGQGLLAEAVPADLGLEALLQQALLVEAGERGGTVYPEQPPVGVVLRRLDLGEQRAG